MLFRIWPFVWLRRLRNREGYSKWLIYDMAEWSMIGTCLGLNMDTNGLARASRERKAGGK
jgi:hypothetical protein